MSRARPRMSVTRVPDRRTIRSLALSLLLAGGLALPASAAPAGYPTAAVVDYVLGCMASHGGTPDALQRCACSINQLAARLSYDDYEKAETVLRMRRETTGRDQVTMFKTAPWAQEMVDKLRRAQLEADLECF